MQRDSRAVLRLHLLHSIHERSGREKIFSSNVAHGECPHDLLVLCCAPLTHTPFCRPAVLNDEVSRKYIQSLKRLMTFAQTKVSLLFLSLQVDRG